MLNAITPKIVGVGATIIYECLFIAYFDEIKLTPLYKANLETALKNMDGDGIKFVSPTIFYAILGEIHKSVMLTVVVLLLVTPQLCRL